MKTVQKQSFYYFILEWHGQSVSICLLSGTHSPESDHPMYLSVEPSSTSNDCKMTIDLSPSHRMRIVIIESDSNLVLKYCALENIAYLYILPRDTSSFDFYPALDAIRSCNWDDFNWNVETNTDLEIYFSKSTSSLHYGLILEITGINMSYNHWLLMKEYSKIKTMY